MAKKTTTTKKAKLPPMPKGDRVVAMIHFNTPEITEAAVQSIRKHGGEKYEIVIFDNSADSTTTLGTNHARLTVRFFAHPPSSSLVLRSWTLSWICSEHSKAAAIGALPPLPRNILRF